MTITWREHQSGVFTAHLGPIPMEASRLYTGKWLWRLFDGIGSATPYGYTESEETAKAAAEAAALAYVPTMRAELLRQLAALDAVSAEAVAA